MGCKKAVKMIIEMGRRSFQELNIIVVFVAEFG